MAVKSAMRQVGGLHDVGQADAAKALAAKQRAGGIDDAFAVSRRPSSRLTLMRRNTCSNAISQARSRPRRLTIYMTADINTQDKMMVVI